MKKNKASRLSNSLNHLAIFLILTLLGACTGSSGDGNANNENTDPIGDLSGNWQVTGTESSSTPECDGVSFSTLATIVQSGNNISATGDDGSSLSGTITGNQVSFSGSYPEDGGTTIINSSTLTISTDCNQFSGNDSWSWTNGVLSCSGTSTYTGTRLTGSGCSNGNNTSNSSNEILFGTASNDSARGIFVDEARSRILITGKTSGNLSGKINAGAEDIFVAEYDLDLNEQWTTLIGTVASDDGRAVAVNSIGEIYVTGSTAGNLGGESNQGLNDIFLAKLDTSGSLQWVKLIGTVADDDARGLAIDSNDNIYVSGGSGASLDGQTYAGGVNDMLLAKYNGAGNRIWLKLAGGTFSDFIRDVTIDSNDNIYVCGWLSTTGAQIYLARYDTSGNMLWNQLLGESPSNDFCQSVTTDSSGNIYLSGGSFFNLDGITNRGERDVAIAKYDSAGNKLWTKLLGSTAKERGFGISVSSTNTVYVTGFTSGNLNNINNLGVDDIFVSSFDSNGNLQSVNLYGTVESDIATDIDISSTDSIYITGRSKGNLNGNTNAGGSDIFIKKL